MSLTRFSVKPLSTMTRQLAAVASGRADPDVVIKGARVLSTYSERLLADRDIWLTGGRVAAVKPLGGQKGAGGRIYDAPGRIGGPRPGDTHSHIRARQVTWPASRAPALRNGTATE